MSQMSLKENLEILVIQLFFRIIPKLQNPAIPEADLGDGVSVIADDVTSSRLSSLCMRKRVAVVEFRSYTKSNPPFSRKQKSLHCSRRQRRRRRNGWWYVSGAESCLGNQSSGY